MSDNREMVLDFPLRLSFKQGKLKASSRFGLYLFFGTFPLRQNAKKKLSFVLTTIKKSRVLPN